MEIDERARSGLHASFERAPMIDRCFLNEIRLAELKAVLDILSPPRSILELGAGTGIQAKAFDTAGFDVTAVDIASSAYTPDRVFEVLDYDGQTLPFPDHRFDCIYSSNVLEHIDALADSLAECRRVLKPGGYSVHLMPSVPWRLWTFAMGPAAAIKDICLAFRLLVSGPAAPSEPGAARALKSAIAALLPLAHGTARTGLEEIWTFSRTAWQQQFARSGLEVTQFKPVGLFYTGHMVLGARLSLGTRAKLAKLFGSGSNLYLVKNINATNMS